MTKEYVIEYKKERYGDWTMERVDETKFRKIYNATVSDYKNRDMKIKQVIVEEH